MGDAIKSESSATVKSLYPRALKLKKMKKIPYKTLVAVMVGLGIFATLSIRESEPKLPPITDEPVVAEATSTPEQPKINQAVLTKPPPKVTCQKYGDERDTVLDLVNEARAINGRNPVCRNPLLDAAAQTKVNAMLDGGFFSHTDPDGRYFNHYIVDVGYRGLFMGENLSRRFSESDAVVAWINSPTHRDVMLSAKYTDTGIAIKDGYIVHMFGGGVYAQ